MKSAVAMFVLALVAAACSGNGGGTTTTVAPPTTADDPTEVNSVSEAASTTSTLPAGDAAFALNEVRFGDNGWIDIVNLGPDRGDPGGHWIAMHPFYLEVPSTALEVGESVALTFGNPSPRGTASVFPINEKLPVPDADAGEVGLYSSGDFGDPLAIVDYVEWGDTPHFRNPVAVAARIWPDGGVVAVPAGALALVANRHPTFGPDDWAPE